MGNRLRNTPSLKEKVGKRKVKAKTKENIDSNGIRTQPWTLTWVSPAKVNLFEWEISEVTVRESGKMG